MGSDAELHENGRARGGHDAVVCRGGHAHAQDEAADHGEHQADDDHVARHEDDHVDDGRCQARHGDAACDHAGHSAGDGDGYVVLRAGRRTRRPPWSSAIFTVSRSTSPNVSPSARSCQLLSRKWMKPMRNAQPMDMAAAEAMVRVPEDTSHTKSTSGMMR